MLGKVFMYFLYCFFHSIDPSLVSIEPSTHLPVTGDQSGGRWTMARPLSQILPPDLPSAGASPQFGNSSQAGGLIGGGHNSTANLKSLLQLPVKADQRVKDCCEMKGEKTHLTFSQHCYSLLSCFFSKSKYQAPGKLVSSLLWFYHCVV